MTPENTPQPASSDPTVAHKGISSADSGGARNTRRHAAATAHAAAAGGHTPRAAVARHHREAAPAAAHAQYRMSAAPVAAVQTWITTKDATVTEPVTDHCHGAPDVVAMSTIDPTKDAATDTTAAV